MAAKSQQAKTLKTIVVGMMVGGSKHNVVAGQRHMWGGSVYAVALHDYDVGLYS